MSRGIISCLDNGRYADRVAKMSNAEVVAMWAAAEAGGESPVDKAYATIKAVKRLLQEPRFIAPCA